MAAVSEKYSVKKKQEQNLIAIIIGFIHITGILTFGLFEGDFNNDKIIDKLKRELKFIKQTHTKIGF